MFFSQYSDFRDDVVSTFPGEYDDTIPSVPEDRDGKLKLVLLLSESWEPLRNKILRKDNSVFDDVPPEKHFMHTVPVKEILSRCSDENATAIWKYIQSLCVFGSAIHALVSDTFSDSLPDTIIDDSSAKQVQEQANKTLFQEKGSDSKEIKLIKRIFRELIAAVSSQMLGKNTKYIMKMIMKGDPSKVMNINKLIERIQPLLDEMNEMIARGESSEDQFKQEAMKMIMKLQEMGGVGGDLSGIMKMASKQMMKYDKFDAEKYKLPEMPDLQTLPGGSGGSGRRNNKKKRNKRR